MNDSRIRYCQFDYPPSNANTQPAESEFTKKKRRMKPDTFRNQITRSFRRCNIPLYELLLRSNLVLLENESKSPSGIPDGHSADSQQ